LSAFWAADFLLFGRPMKVEAEFGAAQYSSAAETFGSAALDEVLGRAEAGAMMPAPVAGLLQ
jgi:hypothetical protein